MADGKEDKHHGRGRSKRTETRRSLNILRVNGETDGVFYGYGEDLSKGGMFISTINPRPMGDEFAISFAMPDDGRRITCRCKVVREIKYVHGSKDEPGMGVRFIDLNDEMRYKIDEWVKKG